MELGPLYATKRVAEYASQNPIFRVELSIILSRYCSGDWGELCKEDREQNDCANCRWADNGQLWHLRRKGVDYYRVGQECHHYPFPG